MPELRGADIVIVHSMSRAHARALRAVPRRSLVVWIGYGYDYWGLLSQQIGGYWFAKTEALLAQLALRDTQLKTMRPHVTSVAHRVNVFSVNPSEVAIVREALPQLRAAYHPLPSFTVEDVFAQGPPEMVGPDVLLGHSASSDNNHLEVFDLLHTTLPAEARLLVPLSYGNARYADHVEQAGRDMFGDRFVALRTWMPIADYQRQIARCGFVVMNQRRQKAVGNISSALYKGAKVFMQRRNPLVNFFTDLGAAVFDIDELGTDPIAAWQPLDASQRQLNRDAMVRRFSRASVVGRIAALEALWREHQIRG